MSETNPVKRHITQLNVHYISLVAKPANGKAVVLKNRDMQADTFRILKADEAMQRVYGIVYSPDEVDSQGDTATAEVIRKAATKFMRSGRTRRVDVDHGFNDEDAFVAESWLLLKNDPRFPNEPEGSWAVGIQILDVDIWKDFKNGKLAGLSLAGSAKVKPAVQAEPQESFDYTEKEATSLFARWYASLTKTNQGASEMNEQEIRQIVADEVQKSVQQATALKKTAGTATNEPKQVETTAATPITKADMQQMIDSSLADILKKGSDTSHQPAATGDFL